MRIERKFRPSRGDFVFWIRAELIAPVEKQVRRDSRTNVVCKEQATADWLRATGYGDDEMLRRTPLLDKSLVASVASCGGLPNHFRRQAFRIELGFAAKVDSCGVKKVRFRLGRKIEAQPNWSMREID